MDYHNQLVTAQLINRQLFIESSSPCKGDIGRPGIKFSWGNFSKKNPRPWLFLDALVDAVSHPAQGSGMLHAPDLQGGLECTGWCSTAGE
jgi:hypothetical protein